MALFWLILSIALWGLVHSMVASHGFKDFLRRTLGDGFMKFYRLLYNIFAVVSIAPALYLAVALPDRELYRIPAPWSYGMLAGQGLSALLLLVAVLQTDVFSFIGLRQLIEGEKPARMVTGGLYRLVRHPLYTFSLLVLWMAPTVSLNSFIMYVSFTAYILIGIFFEERKLLREFGQEYASYKTVTPMLIPGVRFNRNK
jgi:protein-S-isoprenylcysteine O-methyltransferase Ste14